MSENGWFEQFKWNERLATFIFHLIVSLMLACVVFSVVQLGEYLIPSWSGDYLIVVCFIVAVEALYSHRVMRQIGLFSKEWLLYRGTEWVVILVCLKLALYLVRGVGQLWIDIPLWRQDFLNTFFNDEYMFAIIMIFMVWAVAGIFSDDLVKMEGDEKLLWVERESGIIEHRPEARRNLANLILIIGGLMIAMAALERIDWQALWGTRPPLTGSVLNVFAYFVLALILLSLTQISILRVHWSLQRIPISRDLTARWLAYSAVFLLVLILVVILLPTDYSVGVLTVLSYILYILSTLLSVILLILMIPLFILLGLLAHLMGRQVPLAPPQLQPLLPPSAGAVPTPWTELLKSILFWLVFLGIIGYSLHYYFKQNRELVDRLRRIPLLNVLIHLLQRVWNWLRGVNEILAANVEAGLRRLRARQANFPGAGPWSFINLRRLSPRERVLFFYLAMVRRGNERSLPRHPSQTPYEYSHDLEERHPEVESEITSITERFVEAKYSRHEITPQYAGLVQRCWERIKRALRREPGT